MRDFSALYVRFGSKADEATLRGNVRFTPESGHWSHPRRRLAAAASAAFPFRDAPTAELGDNLA